MSDSNSSPLLSLFENGQESEDYSSDELEEENWQVQKQHRSPCFDFIDVETIECPAKQETKVLGSFAAMDENLATQKPPYALRRCRYPQHASEAVESISESWSEEDRQSDMPFMASDHSSTLPQRCTTVQVSLINLKEGTAINFTIGVGRPLVLGRERGCDVVVGSRLVSSKHMALSINTIFPQLQLKVDDLQSTNGVYVNFNRLNGTSTMLHSGDKLGVGLKGDSPLEWSLRLRPGDIRGWLFDAIGSDPVCWQQLDRYIDTDGVALTQLSKLLEMRPGVLRQLKTFVDEDEDSDEDTAEVESEVDSEDDIQAIPVASLVSVFKHLGPWEALRLSLVSRSFLEASREPLLWKHYCVTLCNCNSPLLMHGWLSSFMLSLAASGDARATSWMLRRMQAALCTMPRSSSNSSLALLEPHVRIVQVRERLKSYSDQSDQRAASVFLSQVATLPRRQVVFKSGLVIHGVLRKHADAFVIYMRSPSFERGESCKKFRTADTVSDQSITSVYPKYIAAKDAPLMWVSNDELFLLHRNIKYLQFSLGISVSMDSMLRCLTDALFEEINLYREYWSDFVD